MSKEAMKLALDLATMHHTDESYYELRSKVRVAAKEALAKQEQGEPAPVAKNENGSIKWLIDDWPQNCLLYTHQPQSFTYEQVKAHIQAASMSANDISVGSDTTEDGVSIVIRRRDEILYAEFFAYTTPQQRKPLTDEQIEKIWGIHKDDDEHFDITYERDITRAIEAAHGIKE